MGMKSFFYILTILVLFGACTSTEKPDNKTVVQTDEMTIISQKISLDSSNALLYNERALLFLKNGQVDKALFDLNKALEIDSRNDEIFLTLAEVYFVMGRFDNCNSALQKAAEINPYNPKPFVKLAELNLMMDNLNLALSYTDKSLELSNFNPEAYYVRGMIFLSRNDTVSAIKNLMLALDQKEDFYESMMQIGIIFSNQRNPLAEQYLKKILTRFPETLQARYQLALYLQDNNRYEEALLHYDTLLQISPSNKFVLFNIGYVQLVYLEDYAKSITYFDEALTADPDYIDALYNKGRALEELGRYLLARELYQKVLERATNYPLAIEGLNRLDRRK
jgi:tetratricopeptide (TPR) repeat protein